MSHPETDNAMATSENACPSQEELSKFQTHWGWLFLLGAVQLIGGVLALALPWVATWAGVVFFGAVLLAAGAMQLIHAFQVHGWQGMLWHLLSGALYVLGGLILVAHPLVGALAWTLFLAAMFIVDGVFRIVTAFRVRPRDGWGVFAVGGVLSLLVGALVWLKWPSSAVWAIGLLLGINLIFQGSAMLVLSLAYRRLRQEVMG